MRVILTLWATGGRDRVVRELVHDSELTTDSVLPQFLSELRENRPRVMAQYDSLIETARITRDLYDRDYAK